jgi:hypothetical protein
MDADLAEKLNRRIRRIESIESSSINGNGITNEFDLPSPSASDEYQRSIVFNPYNEFSRQQIQKLMQTFEK